MELPLDLRWRRAGTNGSLMEGDAFGLGVRLGRALLDELERLGSTFVSGYVVHGVEQVFYESLGFEENEGHLVYCVDTRPYRRG